MSDRQILQQGDWGYGDINGLAKEVDVGYRKWLAKNNLEPEGPGRGGSRSKAALVNPKLKKKEASNFSYGKKNKDKT